MGSGLKTEFEFGSGFLFELECRIGVYSRTSI
jgi:hypothetical protein